MYEMVLHVDMQADVTMAAWLLPIVVIRSTA